MKYLNFILIVLLLFSCKNDVEKEQEQKVKTAIVFDKDIPVFEEVLPFDTIHIINEEQLYKTKSIEIKRQALINKKDDKTELKKLVTKKTFKRDEDLYLIDFTYPHLNENVQPSYYNFNEYLEETYMDMAGVEPGILEDKEMIYDTIRVNRFKEQRLVDYKLYNLNKNLISVLFYKENYYSGTLHPTYSFDCLNFNLASAVFMDYEDFFNEGSEAEMAKIVNEIIAENIFEGDMYYDCWEISFDDFFEYKDNFVIDDFKVEYYFDDWVICPSYTGTFSVQIPLECLKPVLNTYKFNPLL